MLGAPLADRWVPATLSGESKRERAPVPAGADVRYDTGGEATGRARPRRRAPRRTRLRRAGSEAEAGS